MSLLAWEPHTCINCKVLVQYGTRSSADGSNADSPSGVSLEYPPLPSFTVRCRIIHVDMISAVVLVCLFRCTAFPLTSLYEYSYPLTHTLTLIPLSNPVSSLEEMAGGLLHCRRRGDSVVQKLGRKKQKGDNLQPSGLRPPDCRTIIGPSSRSGRIECGAPIERNVWILLFCGKLFCLSPSIVVAGIKGELCPNSYLSLFCRGKFVYFASTISLARFSFKLPPSRLICQRD